MRSYWLLLSLVGWLTPEVTRAFHIRLHGLVTEHFSGDGMKGVQVRLVKDSVERETVITGGNGHYELFLERGYDYVVWFHRRDMVTKHVRIDATGIPLFPDVPYYDMDLQVTLFEWIEGFDFGLLDAPVGMAAYRHSVRNLNWDTAYNDGMRPQVARMMVLYERELYARSRRRAKVGSKATVRRRKEVEF
jgi:hypothetical protein